MRDRTTKVDPVWLAGYLKSQAIAPPDDCPDLGEWAASSLHASFARAVGPDPDEVVQTLTEVRLL